MRRAGDEFLEQALAQGHEGIMAKAIDAKYAAGARGQSWVKVKRARTLDLVILAAEWGNGRRKGWLSNLHLGARDTEKGGFAMLGKTFKGLTDEMLEWQTQELLKIEIGRDSYTVHVEPKLVVEIAFNEIQVSPRYVSGLALRFARVKRYRTDKTAAEADTFEMVQHLSGIKDVVAKPVALTIAGSDPSGGAGIQADLKTFHQFGVYGEAVITLITVQNTRGVERIEYLAPDLVADQIRAVIGDIPPAAAKTGALGNRGIIEAVARLAAAFPFPLVVDPVISSKHGATLLEADAIDALKTQLLPHTFLLTPNLEEAALLTGAEVRNTVDMRKAAEKLARIGTASRAHQRRASRGRRCHRRFVPPGRVPGVHFASHRNANTHGTGCTLSAAITAGLASRLRSSRIGGKSKTLRHCGDPWQPPIGRRLGAFGLPRSILSRAAWAAAAI